jgi:hypothetical protein
MLMPASVLPGEATLGCRAIRSVRTLAVERAVAVGVAGPAWRIAAAGETGLDAAVAALGAALAGPLACEAWRA